jgi:hypothetical protein
VILVTSDLLTLLMLVTTVVRPSVRGMEAVSALSVVRPARLAEKRRQGAEEAIGRRGKVGSDALAPT